MFRTQRWAGPYSFSINQASSTLSGARQSFSKGPVIRIADGFLYRAIRSRRSRRARRAIETCGTRRLTILNERRAAVQAAIAALAKRPCGARGLVARYSAD